jgi:hypothetical protein
MFGGSSREHQGSLFLSFARSHGEVWGVEEKNSFQSRFVSMRLLEMTGQNLEKMRPWPLLFRGRSFPWSMELFLTSVLGCLWWDSQQDPALFLPSSVAPEERMGTPPGDLPGCAQWAGYTPCAECSCQVVELQEHDLCNNFHQDFWTTWSGTKLVFAQW